MANWYEEATWTCPICDYTLIGDNPNNPVHVICDKCKKDENYDPNGLPKDFTDRYHD